MDEEIRITTTGIPADEQLGEHEHDLDARYSPEELEVIDEELAMAEYEREINEGRRDFGAIKWIAEGAETPAEIATRLREEAAHYERLAAEGWQLDAPVDNGQVSLYKPEQIAE